MLLPTGGGTLGIKGADPLITFIIRSIFQIQPVSPSLTYIEFIGVVNVGNVMKQVNQTILIFALSIMLSVLTGCGPQEDDSASADGAPQVPPQGSLVMETEGITGPTTAAASSAGFSSSEPTLLSTSNHNYAAFNVLAWSAIIRVGLAVPVTAFLHSFRHRPIRQPDGSWVWSYAVTVLGQLYSAQLQGQIVNDEVHWDMYITKEGEYSRFNWFSGVSKRDNSDGYWILNKNPLEPVNLLRIDWHRDFSTNTADIKYTNIEPGGAENGGYIFYGTTTDQTYNAFYDIYNIGADSLIEIEWHRTNKDGRVRNLQHFGNEDWHYWDENFQDVDAPVN